tara:strand:- start:4523 stop:4984 length:462 start_codon:yes stop_codon:yes gene_type:complete
MKILITKTEFEILEHRLTVPDAMHDNFTDKIDDTEQRRAEATYPAERLESACNAILGQLCKGFLDIEELSFAGIGPSYLDSGLVVEVLDNACSHSTYFATLHDDHIFGTAQRIAAHHRAADNLEEKFKSAGLLDDGDCPWKTSPGKISHIARG